MRDADREGKRDEKCRRIGEVIEALGGRGGFEGWEGAQLKSIKVRFPTEEDPSTLLIVRVSREGGPQIAFIGAFSLGSALLAMSARARAGTMRWKLDIPWEDRQ